MNTTPYNGPNVDIILPDARKALRKEKNRGSIHEAIDATRKAPGEEARGNHRDGTIYGNPAERRYLTNGPQSST